MSHRALLLLLLVTASLPGRAADFPHVIPLQGLLRDASGLPLPDGRVPVTFRLYAVESGGSALWTEAWQPAGATCGDEDPDCVAVSQGVFSVLLGTRAPLTAELFLDVGELWLGLQVKGAAELPRLPLGAAAFALRASRADRAGAAGEADWADGAGVAALATEAQHAAAATLADRAALADRATLAADLACEGCVSSDELASEALPASLLPHDGLDEVSGGLLSSTFEGQDAAEGLPMLLGDLSGVEALLHVDAPGALQRLSVRVALTHPDPAELRVTLLAPDGHSFVLFDHAAGHDGGFDLRWPPEPCVGDDLLSLLGSDPTGTWVLNVLDTEAGATGTLDVFELATTSWRDDVLQVAADTHVTGGLSAAGSFSAGGDARIGGSLDLAGPLTCPGCVDGGSLADGAVSCAHLDRSQVPCIEDLAGHLDARYVNGSGDSMTGALSTTALAIGVPEASDAKLVVGGLGTESSGELVRLVGAETEPQNYNLNVSKVYSAGPGHPRYEWRLNQRQYNGYNGTVLSVSDAGRVGIGLTAPKARLSIAGYKTYAINHPIVSDTSAFGDPSDFYLLLHRVYESALLEDHYLLGTFSGRRGSSGASNRKVEIRLDTSSAYNTTRAFVRSTVEDWKPVLLTYGGVRYLALRGPVSSVLSGLEYTGWMSVPSGEALKPVKPADVSNVADYTAKQTETVYGHQVVNGDVRTRGGSFQVAPKVEYVYVRGSSVSGHQSPRCTCDVDDQTAECATTFTGDDQGETCYDRSRQCFLGCWNASYPFVRHLPPGLQVTAGGRVGVRTDDPQHLLHVWSTNDQTLFIGAGTSEASTHGGTLQIHGSRLRDTGSNLELGDGASVVRIHSGKFEGEKIRLDAGGTSFFNGGSLHVGGGDVHTSTAGSGLILKSPNGNACRRLGIDDNGSLTLTAVTCP